MEMLSKIPFLLFNDSFMNKVQLHILILSTYTKSFYMVNLIFCLDFMELNALDCHKSKSVSKL